MFVSVFLQVPKHKLTVFKRLEQNELFESSSLKILNGRNRNSCSMGLQNFKAARFSFEKKETGLVLSHNALLTIT